MYFSVPVGFYRVAGYTFDHYEYFNEEMNMFIAIYTEDWEPGDMEARYNELKGRDGVVFSRIKSDRFSVSGYRDNGATIYYIYGQYDTVDGERISNEFWMSYPTANRQYCDYAVEVLVKSVSVNSSHW